MNENVAEHRIKNTFPVTIQVVGLGKGNLGEYIHKSSVEGSTININLSEIERLKVSLEEVVTHELTHAYLDWCLNIRDRNVSFGVEDLCKFVHTFNKSIYLDTQEIVKIIMEIRSDLIGESE